jgi:hypothetical protein
VLSRTAPTTNPHLVESDAHQRPDSRRMIAVLRVLRTTRRRAARRAAARAVGPTSTGCRSRSLTIASSAAA